MHKMLKSLLPVVWVLAGSLCLCGFDDISLRDIETAVLEEDFQKVSDLSQQFLLSDPPQEQLKEARYFLGLGQL